MHWGLMLKAFGRALLMTMLLIMFFISLWHFTIITIVVIVLSWLSIMFYFDPPEDWD